MFVICINLNINHENESSRSQLEFQCVTSILRDNSIVTIKCDWIKKLRTSYGELWLDDYIVVAVEI